jgi:hypothetical protein
MTFAILRQRSVSTEKVGVTGEFSERLKVGESGEPRSVGTGEERPEEGRWRRSLGRETCAAHESSWDSPGHRLGERGADM